MSIPCLVISYQKNVIFWEGIHYKRKHVLKILLFAGETCYGNVQFLFFVITTNYACYLCKFLIVINILLFTTWLLEGHGQVLGGLPLNSTRASACFVNLNFSQIYLDLDVSFLK